MKIVKVEGRFQLEIRLFVRLLLPKTAKKLPKIGRTFEGPIKWTIWTLLTVETALESTVKSAKLIELICSSQQTIVFVLLAGVNIPLAWSKVQILDRTSNLCGKTVLMQDFCGGSDQSKLWATRFSGFGLFTSFNWNKP